MFAENIDFTDVQQVEQLVEKTFKDSPDRLRHIKAVAGYVKETARQLNDLKQSISIDLDKAYIAALLHDIGYAGEISKTGFHPLDGYNFLKGRGQPELAQLIVGHSNSPEMAELKGLGELDSSDDLIAKLITYWDVQVKQGGQIVPYRERLSDIVERHGEESDTVRAHRMAEPRIKSLMREVEALLSGHN